MNQQPLLGPWVRRFLLEHLTSERNLSRNTQRSYRDTFCLLIPFAAEKLQRPVDKIKVTELSADLVRAFLTYLKDVRKCGTNTHNQRLAGIHALALFIGNRSPEHLAWCSDVRAVPFKRSARTVIHYLDKPELDALLAEPNQNTAQGRRDHALLLFLYNSGARAEELAQLMVADVHFTPSDWNGQAYVQICGKGGRTRQCPLWPSTVHEIGGLIANREPSARLPQSTPCADNTLRNLRRRKAVCATSDGEDAIDRSEASQPAHYSSHDSDASAARRRGHQYHSRLAWPRVSQYDKHIRRN